MNHIQLQNKIFNISSEIDFLNLSIEIFKFQYKYNSIYKKYVNYLGINIEDVKELKQIPFLPIEFFKTKKVIIEKDNLSSKQDVIFKSSGTTGAKRSCHYVYNINVYEKSFLSGFQQFFGSPKDYTIIALLPSYIEAGNSSLIYMVEKLIKNSGKKESGFYLNKKEKIIEALEISKIQNQKVILFGVSYALLDLSKELLKKYNNLIIIETGGMKGRKKEITRNELHKELTKGFGTDKIYSEYGMTELLSQAYSIENELFVPNNTMKILIRDVNDPFSYLENGKTGGINIIDLANIYSCSFVETKDLGKVKNDSFEVLGRFDDTDLRGCNLLIM